MTRFKRGDWVVTKTFEEWWEYVQRTEFPVQFPHIAREFYDTEFPKNPVMVLNTIEEMKQFEQGTIQLIAVDPKHIKPEYISECFRLATPEELALWRLLNE